MGSWGENLQGRTEGADVGAARPPARGTGRGARAGSDTSQTGLSLGAQAKLEPVPGPAARLQLSEPLGMDFTALTCSLCTIVNICSAPLALAGLVPSTQHSHGLKEGSVARPLNGPRGFWLLLLVL